MASSATAKERDHKHEGTNDDQNDRCVEVGVPQKVKVLGHVDLDKSTNANESHTCQNQDKVEKKNYREKKQKFRIIHKLVNRWHTVLKTLFSFHF